MKRIAILVNKDFEYAGFIEGLRDTVQVYAGTNGRDAECRFDNLIADIYCIQNLFGITENSSNSELKYGYLKDLFKSNAFRLEDCDGILSFSTSESTDWSEYETFDSSTDTDINVSRNGCVYVGNKFFLSDQQKTDKTTKSHLKIGSKKTNYTEEYIETPIYKLMYKILSEKKMNLKSAFNNSADKLCCIAHEDDECVGVVNVMDYSCYSKADEKAYRQYKNSGAYYPVGIETTHGVVVKALHDTFADIKFYKKDIPVNFISPIVDRYLKFDEDVDGKYGKQNYICSYNGGVVTGHMLKILNENWK